MTIDPNAGGSSETAIISGYFIHEAHNSNCFTGVVCYYSEGKHASGFDFAVDKIETQLMIRALFGHHPGFCRRQIKARTL
jgi:hypothetical protein